MCMLFNNQSPSILTVVGGKKSHEKTNHLLFRITSHWNGVDTATRAHARVNVHIPSIGRYRSHKRTAFYNQTWPLMGG